VPRMPEIKGWCPSAHRPMASGDGLLIRAKSRQWSLTAAQLRAVADVATHCGNGLIDLTQRAQLQLRGLSDATLDEARSRLKEHELFSPEQRCLIDIFSGGYIGVDEPAHVDANALIQALSHTIEDDPALRALPPKFLIVLDSGLSGSLAEVSADIRIEALDAKRAAVCVAGAPDRGHIVSARDVAPAVHKLARSFLALRAERPFELRRMRHLVAAQGLDALLREAKLEMQPYKWRAPISVRSVLGVMQKASVASAGVAAPFGRWRARELAALASLADDFGEGVLVPTHWRVFLIPARNAEAARRVLDAARKLDLIVGNDDPRLSVAACPGAPECPQAQGETRSALARLAPLAQKLAGEDGVGLHISGCAKGCARPKSAPVTLIANDGGFDLVEHGRANDAPSLKSLDTGAIERALVERARENPCPTP
jgi:precorrin-3B synthase